MLFNLFFRWLYGLCPSLQLCLEEIWGILTIRLIVSSRILPYWRLTPIAQIIWRQVKLFLFLKFESWEKLSWYRHFSFVLLLPLQFLKIATTKVSNSREQIVKWHSRDLEASVSPILGLTKCADSNAAGWITESLDRGLEKICWKANPEHKYQTPLCLYKRGSRVAM